MAAKTISTKASDSDDDESKLWDHGDSPPGFWEIASQLGVLQVIDHDHLMPILRILH